MWLVVLKAPETANPSEGVLPSLHRVVALCNPLRLWRHLKAGRAYVLRSFPLDCEDACLEYALSCEREYAPWSVRVVSGDEARAALEDMETLRREAQGGTP